MPSGDSLSVLLFLVGTSVGAAIGAVTAPKGWRAHTLWGACVLFAFLSLGWFARPSASWITIVAPYLVAIVPLMTVSGVALMLRKQSTPHPGVDSAPQAERGRKGAPAKPEDRIKPPHPSRWVPDMTVEEVGKYIASKTRWRPQYGNVTPGSLAEEIHRALYRGEVTAWGRLHPEAEEAEIATTHWNHADLDRLDGYAYFKMLHLPVYGLRLSKGQVEAAWPSRV